MGIGMLKPVALVLVGLMAHGCARRQATTGTDKGSEVPVEAQVAAEESPLRYRAPAPVRQHPDTLVSAGKLPLAYIADTGGEFRIIDVTANRVLLRQGLLPRTVIGVSESGIVLGSQKVLAGPLAGDHEYQIWLEARRAP